MISPIAFPSAVSLARIGPVLPRYVGLDKVPPIPALPPNGSRGMPGIYARSASQNKAFLLRQAQSSTSNGTVPVRRVSLSAGGERQAAKSTYARLQAKYPGMTFPQSAPETEAPAEAT